MDYEHGQVSSTHKDITKRIRIRTGCPQGGILSPFLWNLVVDNLLKFSAKEIPGYLQAFADDLVRERLIMSHSELFSMQSTANL